MERKPKYWDDVSECLEFNPNEVGAKRCMMNIKESSNNYNRYNCAKNGPCSWFISQEEHEKIVKARREENDKQTYRRLKKKYESHK